ncbi:MAG: M48 family metalloprotease [Planctomycetota bacterium]
MPSIHVLVALVALLLGREIGLLAPLPVSWAVIASLAAAALPLGTALLVAAAMPLFRRQADRAGSVGALREGLRFAALARWLVVLPYAIWSIAGDAAGQVAAAIGDFVGLDEALAAAPPLAALLVVAWAEHPLHARIREAMLVRQLDEGGLDDRPPTRAEWTATALRSMLAMPLMPVFLIVCWHEIVGRLAGWLPESAPEWSLIAADIAGTVAIVACAPALIVRVLGTRPLGPGELRSRIDALQRRMHARVRAVRIWRTPATNAAVLGLLPGVRYMLLTDALVRSMPRGELDAVIAHELAHVRHQHVLWIVLSIAAAAVVLGTAAGLIALGLSQAGVPLGLADALLGIASIAGTILVFGFVSRRVERQADATAAVALDRLHAEADEGVPVNAQDPIVGTGPALMSAALGRVCALSGVPPARWGFRHGSVRQRQRNLARLVGARPDRLPIDRTMRWIRVATLVAIGLGAIGGALGVVHIA